MNNPSTFPSHSLLSYEDEDDKDSSVHSSNVVVENVTPIEVHLSPLSITRALVPIIDGGGTPVCIPHATMY